MIKIKSLTMKRYETAQKSDVRKWFDRYQRALNELKIERRNLINFEESEFRIECLREEQIIVFDNIKELYSVNSENLKSITMIEMINAVDDYSSLFMINIQRQEIMTNWFSNDVSSNTLIVFSENDFTFDKIALKFLKHYIKHLNAELNAK
jgi:hypothetical protein